MTKRSSRYQPPPWLGTLVVLVLLATFVSTVVVTVFNPSYTIPAPLVQALMVALTAVFGVQVVQWVRRNGDGNGT